MLKMSLIAATAAFAGLSLPGVARAEVDYPYCAVAGGYNAYENCGYATLNQCFASVSGVGGHCQENPRYFADRRYADPDQPPLSRRRAR